MKNQYRGGDCLKRAGEGGGLGQFIDLRGAWGERGGGVFEWGADFPMPTMITLSHLELSRIDLPELNSSILMKIVTIPVSQVDEFYFYTHYPIRLGFLKKLSLN